MDKIVALKNDVGATFFEMYFLQEANCLYCNWLGYTIRTDSIAGSTEMMKWAAEHAAAKGVTAIINDNRKKQGTWADVVDWISEVWSPAMYKAGIRKNAVILSDDIFTQLSAEALQENSEKAGFVVTNRFNSMEEAVAWISPK